MNYPDSISPVRERIKRTACDLFYQQGYQATGVNQIIRESGVAKATFYAHFPSKEDLLYEYAQETARQDIEELRSEVIGLPTAHDRFLSPFKVLLPWFVSSGYRGCPFQNLMAEIGPDVERIRNVVIQQKNNLRSLFLELSVDLKKEDNLEHIDPVTLADTYLLLFEGAIVTAVAYQDNWPVARAIETLERSLIKV